MTQSSSFFHLPPPRRYRLLLFPAALLLRLANWAGVFTPFGVLPEGPDSFFHLRRILGAAAHYPFVPDTDRYLNFPEGGHTYWPYGFDLLYAAAGKILTLGQADEWWMTAIASLVTPVIGSLIPLAAFSVAEELKDWRAGLLAGGLAVVLQPLVLQSMVGVIDHHVFEAFFLSLYLLALTRMLKRATESDAAPLTRPALGIGLSLVGGLLFTTVFPFVVGLHFGLTGLLPLATARETRGRTLDGLVQSWWGATVGLAPFVISRFFEPSGVNPSLTIGWLAAAAGLLAASLGRSIFSRGAVPLANRATIAAGVFALAAGALLDYRGVATYAAFGNRFVFSSDPIISGILESAPLWQSGLAGILRVGTGLAVLYPVGVVWLAWRGWRREQPGLLALAMISLALAAMGVNQMRFLNFAAAPFVAALGVALFLGVDEIRRLERMPEDRLRLAVLLVLGVSAIPVYPMLEGLRQPRIVSSDGRFMELYPTLQWIAAHTPPTSPEGNAPGDYSVTARWDFGHWIVQVAKRPCLGSPLTFPWHQRGIKEGAVIFFEPPDRALELMRRRRARYILISPLSINHFLPLSRWDIASNIVAPISDADRETVIRNGLYAQLLVGLGVPEGSSSPAGLRHFRLVHESRELRFPGMQRPFAMLFEAVSGANVQGRTVPGAKVTVSGAIQAGNGRTFEYADSVTADAAGGFTVVLPYASGVQRYSEVVAPQGFRIAVGNVAGTVKVSENDVLTGRTFDLGTLGTAPAGK